MGRWEYMKEVREKRDKEKQNWSKETEGKRSGVGEERGLKRNRK